MVRKTPFGYPRSWVEFYKAHWEISPILVICSLACMGYAWISVYMLHSRPDVDWYRGQTQQHVKALTHPHVNKLLKINEEYPPNLELAQLYKDMEEKAKERKKEN